MTSDPGQPTVPLPPSQYGPTTVLPKVSASDPTVPAKAPPRGCFTFRRFAAGCGFGCLGLACLISGGLLAVYRWAMAPSAPIAGEVLIDPETVTATVVVIDPQDPGVADLIRTLAVEIDTNRPTAIPADVRRLMGAFGAKDTPAILNACLPTTVEQVFRRTSDDSESEHEVTAISIGKFANLLGWIADRQSAPSGGSLATHRGHRILIDSATNAGIASSGKARALAGNTVLSASDADTVMHAIDRIEAGDRNLGGDPLLLDLHDRLEKGAFAWGLVFNRGGALVDHFPFFHGLDAHTRHVDQVLGASWDVKLVSADKARGKVHFKMRDAGSAATFARYLAEVADEVRQSASRDSGVDLTYQTESDQAWTEVSFEIDKVGKGLIDKLLGGH